ncbi:MAG: hypothetical protein AAF310_06320 [Myxococcota bacterium]
MLNALLSYVIAHGKVGDTYDKIEEKGVLHGKLEEIYMTIAQALQRKGEQLGLQKGEQLGLQKGEQLGLQKGREKGREEGKILGFEEGRLQIAQNMLRAGIEPKTIAATTGLSPKRIAALSKTK